MDSYPSRYIENAINQLTKLPGVGKRTAMRYVLQLLKMKKENLLEFSNALAELATEVKYCPICHNVSDDKECSICSNPKRDHTIICVVEDLRDVIAIEATQQYKGVYHILGGIISPVDGIGPSDLNIASLLKRIENSDVKEVVFALKSTVEGETTCFYIFRQIADKNLIVSSIARGIAFGDELEYTDELTLGKSIINRVPYQGVTI